jgi:ribosome biogenesis protein YTM1
MSLTVDSQLRVRFLTKHVQYSISDSPFVLPAKLGRAGLSEVVNHLLGGSGNQPFDFSIKGKLIRVPLFKFCQLHSISSEDIVVIDYFPAIGFESSSITQELPSWIGSIDAKEEFGFAACYDGTLKLFNSSDLSIQADIQAHNEPIRAVHTWKEGQNFCVATSSKDSTVKIWSCDIKSKKFILTADLAGHANSVEALTVFRNPSVAENHLLVSGDWSGNLFVWKNPSDNDNESISQAYKKRKGSAETERISVAKPLFTIKGHSQPVTCLQQELNSGHIYSSSWDHSWKLWDLERQDPLSSTNTSKVVTALDTNDAHHSSVATSHPDGKIRIWDTRENNLFSSSLIFGKETSWISQVSRELGVSTFSSQFCCR